MKMMMMIVLNVFRSCYMNEEFGTFLIYFMVMMMMMMRRRRRIHGDDGDDDDNEYDDVDHLHAIDISAGEEGDRGDGDAPSQENKNLTIIALTNWSSVIIVSKITVTIKIIVISILIIITGIEEEREVKDPKMVIAKQAAKQIILRPNLRMIMTMVMTTVMMMMTMVMTMAMTMVMRMVMTMVMTMVMIDLIMMWMKKRW